MQSTPLTELTDFLRAIHDTSENQTDNIDIFRKTVSLYREPGVTTISIRSNNLNGMDMVWRFSKETSKIRKVSLLNDLFATGDITKEAIMNMITPEITQEDLDYWNGLQALGILKKAKEETFKETAEKSALETLKALKVQKKSLPIKSNADLSKEVKKINRLIARKLLTIEDLDKYVTLGIITNAGLRAWRIEDQMKNDFYYEDFFGGELKTAIDKDFIEEEAIKAIDDFNNTLPDLDLPIDKKESHADSEYHSEDPSPLTEMQKVGYRIAGTQINNFTRGAIINTLPTDKMEGMKSFLSSELGNSFVGMVGGLTLTYSMKENDMAQNLAEELRVASIATLGNDLIETLAVGVMDVMKKTVNELPEVDETMEEELVLQSEEEQKEMIV